MKRWYLLYCKRGDQTRAKSHLENQGIECYYPVVEISKIVRGRRKVVTEPLFSSYMFVQFDYKAGPSFTTIRSTRGVVDFVRCGAHPQEVRSSIIDELKSLENCVERIESESVPKEGAVVRIKSGQFADIEAIYQEPDGEKRSILLITLMNQPIPVSIENSDIEI